MTSEVVKVSIVDIEKIKDTFTPSPLEWKKDNGVIFTVYHGDCYACQAQKTAYWLKETDEAFCISCWSATDLRTPFMKNLNRLLKRLRRNIVKILTRSIMTRCRKGFGIIGMSMTRSKH